MATEYEGFGYAFINDYLFVKSQSKIEYLRIFDCDYKSAYCTQVMLCLDPKAIIKRLVQTQRLPDTFDEETKKVIPAPQLVQIIFVDVIEEI